MLNPSASLFNRYVSDTYPRLIQIFSGSFYDGLGNEIFITGSCSCPPQSGSNYSPDIIEYFDFTSSVVDPIITLNNTPTPLTEQIFKNGLKQRSGSQHDYILSSSFVIFQNNHQFFDNDYVEIRYKVIQPVNLSVEYFDITSSTNTLILDTLQVPISGSEYLYKNGLKQRPGSIHDYEISGSQVIFNNMNQFYNGDVIEIRYNY